MAQGCTARDCVTCVRKGIRRLTIAIHRNSTSTNRNAVSRRVNGSRQMCERALVFLTRAVQVRTLLLHGAAHAIRLGLTNLVEAGRQAWSSVA